MPTIQAPYIKFAKLNANDPNAIIPSKEIENAGYDIYANTERDFFINPFTTRLVPTGIAFEIPNEWVLIIKERGGLGSQGIEVRAGVVDSSFRGEIFVALTNGTKKTFVISTNPERTSAYLVKRQEKYLSEKNPELYKKFNPEFFLTRHCIVYPSNKAIAQGLLLYNPHVEPEVVEYDQLSKTERGEGMLGSTGK